VEHVVAAPEQLDPDSAGKIWAIGARRAEALIDFVSRDVAPVLDYIQRHCAGPVVSSGTVSR
jgi:hypothetical protein